MPLRPPAVPSIKRTLEVLRTRSTIFGTTFNPENVRTGAKYLKQRLVGPSMLRYYPPLPNIGQIKRDLGLPKSWVTPKEAQRLADVEAKKRRGKGPPKKGQGRRSQMGKKR